MDGKPLVNDNQLAEADLLSYFSHQSHRQQQSDSFTAQQPQQQPKSSQQPTLDDTTKMKPHGHSQTNLKHLSANKPHFNLVAIHLGAGMSSKINDKLLQLSKRACEDVMFQRPSSTSSTSEHPETGRKKAKLSSDTDHKSNNVSALDGAVQLVKLLEDHYLLNCGYGSNLNMDGRVECDASLMFDKTELWTGVGCVSGCRNPILLAESLYKHQTVPRPLELVQPNLLVSSGAKQWMKEHCRHLSVCESKLISPKSLQAYQKQKSRYDACASNNASEPRIYENDEELSTNLDTVGAIVVDLNGNLASAISSGGILLKCKGRIGQAAIPGAGCWAQSQIAVTTSGVGEYLTVNTFAKSLANNMIAMHNHLSYEADGVSLKEAEDTFKDEIKEFFGHFLHAESLKHVTPSKRYAGSLIATKIEDFLLLGYAHNTKSMYVGYMFNSDKEAHSIHSLRPERMKDGEALVVTHSSER